jgi:hypothetical protein
MKPIIAAPLVAIVLAGAGFGAYFAVAGAGSGEEAPPAQATRTPTAQPTPTPSPTPVATAPSGTPEATPIPGWATLTNTAFGYSIQYPADWLVDPYGRRDESTSDYVAIYNYRPTEGSAPPPDSLKIEIVALPNDQKLPLDRWVVDFIASQITPTTVLSSRTEEVNGVAVIRQVVSFGKGGGALAAFFAAADRVIVINGPQADSPFLQDYERMLGSLRVLP